ncbi:MAG: hypothetical protein RR123_01595 [Clostridia bacterium]
MEDNYYKEHIKENDITLEDELKLPKEVSTEQEKIDDTENNIGVTVVSNDEEAPTKRQDDKNTQSDTATSGASSGVGGSIVGIASAVMASVTIMFLIVTMIANISVNMIKLDVFGTYIKFTVNVKLELKLDKNTAIDYDNLNTGLFLSVFSSKQNFLVPLNAGDEGLESSYEIKSKTDSLLKVEYNFSGKVEGLNEGVRYNIEVFGEDNGSKKSYYNQTFKTIEKITKFNTVKTECRCQIDGNFYFQLDFVDENNYYSNFAYSLKKAGSENIVASGKIDGDLTAKKAIDVSKLPGKDYVLVITFDSSAPSDSKTPTKIIEIKVTF